MSPTSPTHGAEEPPASGRRRLLGAVGGALTAAASGCVTRLTGTVDRDPDAPISLSIKTVPTDTDPRAIRIARSLAGHLERVGVETSVTPMRRAALRRDVLHNHEFDLYVDRHPARQGDGTLRPLFHSRFAVESGWQNPFGYSDIETDRLLDSQRQQSGARRRATLRDAQLAIARDQPCTVVAFPDEHRVCRTDRFEGWDRAPVHTPLGYLGLRERDLAAESGLQNRQGDEPAPPSDDRLTVVTVDQRPTRNLNPLSVEYRGDGTVTGLLYDPLARRIDGTPRPWLAADWTWTEPDRSARPVAEVTLRADLRWHDGTALTAGDVAFTYRLLRDTSLGANETRLPAPRFRGASSLVEGVEWIDDRRARVRFRPCSHEVARTALTVPVLPAHVWRDRTEQVSAPWVEEGAVPEAVVAANLDPVGSGPFRVEAVSDEERLALAPWDGHFLDRSVDDDHLQPFAGPVPFERLVFAVAPAADSALELVLDGDADAVATPLLPGELPDRLPPSYERFVDRPGSFYHVGYNARRAPTSNPRFRRAVARLVDEASLVETAFDGAADPAASPLGRDDAAAPALAWDGGDPLLEFPGEGGELDEAAAREAFRRAGYRYDEDGTLLR